MHPLDPVAAQPEPCLTQTDRNMVAEWAAALVQLRTENTALCAQVQEL